MVVALAALTPASAALMQSCGTPASVVPGASGSCSLTVSDTNAGGYKGQVDVAVALYTTSTSDGQTRGSGVGTEALLDGQPDGLLATVIDTTTNQQFDFGTFTCYKNRTESSPAAYPNASYCASSSRFQTVATNMDIATFSNSFVIHWRFPLAAGNPYQGGRAKIILQSAFTGTSGSGTLGVSTGPTSPNGGVLAASTTTPTTGAQLPEGIAKLLLGAGILLALAGVLLSKREHRTGLFQPPKSTN
jgi:hypothetical protein